MRGNEGATSDCSAAFLMTVLLFAYCQQLAFLSRVRKQEHNFSSPNSRSEPVGSSHRVKSSPVAMYVMPDAHYACCIRSHSLLHPDQTSETIYPHKSLAAFRQRDTVRGKERACDWSNTTGSMALIPFSRELHILYSGAVCSPIRRNVTAALLQMSSILVGYRL